MKPGIGVFAIIFTLFSTVVMASDQVEIKNAWIREAPPMMKMLAGYMEIHNKGDKAIMIRSVTAKDFGRIELHKTIIRNGMAEMKAVPRIIIKAGETVTFKPGSFHMMLFNPTKALKAGNNVEFTMHFSNGRSEAFTATVKKMSAMDGDSSHHMQGMEHDMKDMDHNMDNMDDMEHDMNDMKHDMKK